MKEVRKYAKNGKLDQAFYLNNVTAFMQMLEAMSYDFLVQVVTE